MIRAATLVLDENTTLVATYDVERHYDRYSNSWHRRYGPANTYYNRRVSKETRNPDGTVTAEVLKEFQKWPPGLIRAALTQMIPANLLPLFINSSDVHQDTLERRLKHECSCTPASSTGR